MRDEYDFSKAKRSPYAEHMKPGVKVQTDEIAGLLDELEQETGLIDEETMEEVRREWPALNKEPSASIERRTEIKDQERSLEPPPARS